MKAENRKRRNDICKLGDEKLRWPAQLSKFYTELQDRRGDLTGEECLERGRLYFALGRAGFFVSCKCMHLAHEKLKADDQRLTKAYEGWGISERQAQRMVKIGRTFFDYSPDNVVGFTISKMYLLGSLGSIGKYIIDRQMPVTCRELQFILSMLPDEKLASENGTSLGMTIKRLLKEQKRGVSKNNSDQAVEVSSVGRLTMSNDSSKNASSGEPVGEAVNAEVQDSDSIPEFYSSLLELFKASEKFGEIEDLLKELVSMAPKYKKTARKKYREIRCNLDSLIGRALRVGNQTRRLKKVVQAGLSSKRSKAYVD